jgi:hypothetical protein
MTGAVTHDWQDEADVQCTIRNGRRVKIFTKIEDLGACPDPLPDINASLPSPPTVTDCTDCPAGPKCLWRFFAKYTIGGIWAAYGSPVFIGCRRTKDFPTWRFFNGSTPDCIFAIDVFAEECDEASDCSLTPPTAPDLPTGTATDLGAPLCDEVLTNKCWYRVLSSYTFLDNPDEEWSPVSYDSGTVTCGGAPGPTDWTFDFVTAAPTQRLRSGTSGYRSGRGNARPAKTPVPTRPASPASHRRPMAHPRRPANETLAIRNPPPRRPLPRLRGEGIPADDDRRRTARWSSTSTPKGAGMRSSSPRAGATTPSPPNGRPVDSPARKNPVAPSASCVLTASQNGRRSGATGGGKCCAG